MANFFKRKKKIEGEIGYHGLEEWWLTTFTEKERDYIESVFQPMGLSVGFGTRSNSKPLTEGKINYSSGSAAGLLHSLAGWFNNPHDRQLARKIVQKAEELAQGGSDILDLHFALQQEIEIYYRDRNTDPTALKKSISACEQQIKIAQEAAKAFLKEYPGEQLPAHAGYSQLAIILKKRGEHKRVIEICEHAKKQGWSGNWDRRIEEAKKNLKKKK